MGYEAMRPSARCYYCGLQGFWGFSCRTCELTGSAPKTEPVPRGSDRFDEVRREIAEKYAEHELDGYLLSTLGFNVETLAASTPPVPAGA